MKDKLFTSANAIPMVLTEIEIAVLAVIVTFIYSVICGYNFSGTLVVILDLALHMIGLIAYLGYKALVKYENK